MAARARKIVVQAYIPPLQSAIMVDGAGDSMQIKLSIPLRTSPEGLMLQTMTQKRMIVTFEEDTEEKIEIAPRKKTKWTMYKKEEK